MSDNLMTLIVMAGLAIAMGGAAFMLLSAIFSPDQDAEKRAEAILGTTQEKRKKSSTGLLERLGDTGKEARRKQIEESLKKLEADERKKQKLTLEIRLKRAGLTINTKQFYAYSAIAGFFAAMIVYVAMRDMDPLYQKLASFGALVVGALGLPRWYIGSLASKRQQKFLNDLPDAIDIMVRGLRSGLPVTDAMKVIAEEIPAPVGPEFTKVVEGQKVGIPIEQGLERMYARMPLPEVNFLAIVVNIQKQTGGNLSETLGNLSKVLRDRKKMKQKVKAISQEAKASAAIIGALPFVIMLALSLLNPGYMNPLWDTQTGHILLGIGAGMMITGTLIMRKMINFKM